MQQAKQARVDGLNMSMNKEVAIKRTNAKAQGNVYDNRSWDLVDVLKGGDDALEKITPSQLPDSLKNKSKGEIKVIIQAKANERAALQKQILETNAKREAYIVEERKKRATNANEKTLETEVELIIKEQAKRFNMIIQ
jgi:hypothetical protein